MAQDADPMTPRTDDPDAIARDIRETRAEMDETIQALGDRLDPSHIKDRAIESVTEAAHGMVDNVRDAFSSSKGDGGPSFMDQIQKSSLVDAVKENPLPALAVGLSVAWFVSKLGESEQDRYRRERYETTGDPYYAPRYGAAPRYEDRSYAASSRDWSGAGDESLTDKASDAVDQAKDKAGHLVDAVKDTASDAADAVRRAASGTADRAHAQGEHARQLGHQYARRSTSWMDAQMQRNPLLVGSVAMAAGALVGLSFPETDAEHHLLGETADQAKSKALDVAERASGHVSEAVSEVVEKAKGAAHDVADQAKSDASDVADHAKDAARDVTAEAKAGADQAVKANDAGSASRPASPSSTSTM